MRRQSLAARASLTFIGHRPPIKSFDAPRAGLTSFQNENRSDAQHRLQQRRYYRAMADGRRMRALTGGNHLSMHQLGNGVAAK